MKQYVSMPKLLVAGVLIVASTYGLARYTYGLFVPVFKAEFGLSPSTVGLIGSMSYIGYLLATLLGSAFSRRIGVRLLIVLGGSAAMIGMVIIALAESSYSLMVGVTLAGCSPGLAYPPIADAVKQFCATGNQNRLYAIINSGTSLGIIVSGPLALLAGSNWRSAWLFFAMIAFGATVWNLYVLPSTQNIIVQHADPQNEMGKQDTSLNILRTKLSEPSVRCLFGSALFFGAVTSVYWVFSVDLITQGAKHPAVTGTLFWIVVGLAGIMGAAGGDLVTRYGLCKTLRWSVIILASAILLPALPGATEPIVLFLSAIAFGASFILITAIYGIWSISCFQSAPSLGFGLTFFLISAGQLLSPPAAGFLAEVWTLSTVFQLAATLSLLLLVLLPSKDIRRM